MIFRWHPKGGNFTKHGTFALYLDMIFCQYLHVIFGQYFHMIFGKYSNMIFQQYLNMIFRWHPIKEAILPNAAGLQFPGEQTLNCPQCHNKDSCEWQNCEKFSNQNQNFQILINFKSNVIIWTVVNGEIVKNWKNSQIKIKIFKSK